MHNSDSALDVLCRLINLQALGFLPRNSLGQPIAIVVRSTEDSIMRHLSHAPAELQDVLTRKLLRSAMDALETGDAYEINFSSLGGFPRVKLNGHPLLDDDCPARKQLLADAQMIRNDTRASFDFLARLSAPAIVGFLAGNREMIRRIRRLNGAVTPTGQRQLRVLCNYGNDRVPFDRHRAAELETAKTSDSRILAFNFAQLSANDLTAISGPYLDWLIEELVNALLPIADPEYFSEPEC